MITEDKRFIDIQGILAMSDVHPADCIKINDLIIELSKENQELEKQLEEYQEELEKADSITQSCIFNGKKESEISYRKCLNMLEKHKNQQKEFIKYLEDESKEIYRDGGLRQNIFRQILQKYKSIIGDIKNIGNTRRRRRDKIIMKENEFIKLCKNEIIAYYKKEGEITDNICLEESDVFVVWMCRTLQNNKALLSTNIYDGMYFECTYNGYKKELYIDAYKKWNNICKKLGEEDEEK